MATGGRECARNPERAGVDTMVLKATPRRVAKRALDIVASALALCLCFPMLAAMALLLRVTMGPPVLFRQTRPGMDGRPFSVMKFRTMSSAYGEDGERLPDSERITPVGRWFRAMSFDELPQLWNVLRGDMSLVGPRPLLVQYLTLYTPEQMRRHEVRPGLTGWAQVNGRNEVDWDQRFRLDVWYVDNQSLALDMKIIGMTIWTVLSGKSVSQRGHPTMPEFHRVPAELPATGEESAQGSQEEHRA